MAVPPDQDRRSDEVTDPERAAPGPPADRGVVGGVLGAPGAALGRARQGYRNVERALARRAPARVLVAGPRTARFLGSTAWRRVRGGDQELPLPRLSPGLAAQVALDEAILAAAMGPNRFPRRADYERVSAELAHARLLFEDRGWLDDPVRYHRDPPPLHDPAIDRGWAVGQPYERLLFPSGWAPRREEPGYDRWVGFEANRTALATVLRHRDRPRPWVLAIHGFGMGLPFMDMFGLHARHLHHDLGLNVVMPVLPLHGPRKITRISGEAFLSFDLINTVHGLAQAIWDVRRVLDWVQRQEPQGIAGYGVSLGGYTVSLLAGLVDDLDAVVAGVPVADFPALFRHQSPHHIRLRAVEHEILDGNAEVVHSVVSPLSFEPRVPRPRRFVYAGLGDRMAPPTQARALCRHWEDPEVCWYAGNHVGYLWARQVVPFVDASLRASGIVDEATLERVGAVPASR